VLPKVRKLLFGIPDVQASHDGVCSRCDNGTKKRGPFPSSKNKTSNVLHLIHFDLCGPMLVYSLGVHLYYKIFIDDFSQKIWIFYLKHKDETFDMFKEFKELI